MNESATIASVKSLALSDDEVQHHLQAIRRHQKAMHEHVKCLLGADDLDDDAADDPALLEGNDSEPDVESKALLVELQKLVAQAGDSRAPEGSPSARVRLALRLCQLCP